MGRGCQFTFFFLTHGSGAKFIYIHEYLQHHRRNRNTGYYYFWYFQHALVIKVAEDKRLIYILKRVFFSWIAITLKILFLYKPINTKTPTNHIQG